MPGFNADAWREARERWVLVVDGREYVARDVSAEKVVRAQLQLQGASPAAQRTILLALLRAAFPYRLSMQWRGDPVRLVREMPPEAFWKVVKSFFGYVTGNPVTSETVTGRSPNISSSPPPLEATAAGSPPTP